MPDNIEPLGLEKPKPIKIPTNLSEVKVSNRKGIEETKDVVTFLASVGQSIKLSLADGKINFGDALNFVPPLKNLFPAIKGVKDVPSELADEITQEEFNALKTILIQYDVVPAQSEEAVFDGIKLANEIKDFVFKYFVK